MKTRTVEDYLKLPYTIEVIRDENEENPGWVARVVELPGCLTQADTFAELGEMIADAMHSWIAVALADGAPIPDPGMERQYSGKFVVRVPRSLHRRLAKQAERDNTSLNQWINVALAEALGFRLGSEEAAKDEKDKTWKRQTTDDRRRTTADRRRRTGKTTDDRRRTTADRRRRTGKTTDDRRPIKEEEADGG